MFFAIAFAAAISASLSKSRAGHSTHISSSADGPAPSQTSAPFCSPRFSTLGAGERRLIRCTPSFSFISGFPPKPRECSHRTHPGVQPPLSSKPCSPNASRR